MKVLRLAARDVKSWKKGVGQEIYAGNPASPGETGSIGVGFSHYAGGTSMAWTTAYDEALIVLRGRLTIRPEEEEPVSAGPGEAIFVPRGVTFTYEGTEDTDMVYVTYPQVGDATVAAGLGHLFDNFEDAGERGPRSLLAPGQP